MQNRAAPAHGSPGACCHLSRGSVCRGSPGARCDGLGIQAQERTAPRLWRLEGQGRSKVMVLAGLVPARAGVGGVGDKLSRASS